MPQPYNQAVITDKGMNLLTRAQAGEVKIEFTRVAIGAGTYEPEEKQPDALKGQESLKEEKNSYAISGIEVSDNHSVRIKVLITNQDPATKEVLVSSGYYINEIGLYAKEKDGLDDTEVLYSMAVTSGEKGDFMPPYNGHSPTQIIQEYYATVSNSSEVTVQCNMGATALADDLFQVAENVKEIQAPEFIQAEERENIESKDSLPTIFGKIKKFFADLKQVAFTGSYNDLSNKPTIPAAVRVKGNAETTYHTGDVNITPANIGLGNVDDTADSAKNVNAAIMLKGWPDARNVATTPNDYNSTFKCVGIKTPSACGLSDGSTYYTLFGVRGYGDSTGGQALEIAVSGNNGKLYFRMGATTTWGSWKTFADLTSTVSSANTLANARTIFGRNFNGSGNVAGQGLFYGTYMAAASSRYNNSGLQIRENGQVGNSQSDIAYAPAIGFHWQGKMAGTFAMDSTGTFHLFKQDGVTPANLEATVTKAKSAVKADSATRTENEFISEGKQLTLQSSGIWYRLGHFASTGSAHAEFKVYSSQGSGISICYKFVIGGTCRLKEGWEIEKLYNSKDGSSSFTLDAVRVIAMEETNSSNIYVEVRMRDTGAISGLNTWWYEMEQPKCIQKTWVDDAFGINASIPSVSYKSHITHL